MKWDKHIEYIVNKTKYVGYVFAKFSKFIDTRVLQTLYYALFHSITYGNIAWGGAYKNKNYYKGNIRD